MLRMQRRYFSEKKAVEDMTDKEFNRHMQKLRNKKLVSDIALGVSSVGCIDLGLNPRNRFNRHAEAAGRRAHKNIMKEVDKRIDTALKNTAKGIATNDEKHLAEMMRDPNMRTKISNMAVGSKRVNRAGIIGGIAGVVLPVASLVTSGVISSKLSDRINKDIKTRKQCEQKKKD